MDIQLLTDHKNPSTNSEAIWINFVLPKNDNKPCQNYVACDEAKAKSGKKFVQGFACS